jgi:alanine-glyoxylate transaminase/serine-glyoxylate transaminase/serine-pyruvate transaminase
MAGKLGLDVVTLETDWRGPASPERIAAALAADAGIRAVQVVHNETSTGATTDVGAVRAAIDRVGHPALLLVDAVSSLGSMPVLHDEWRVDVTVSASQKGLMLPPGLVMLAVSERAREARESAGLPRSYWDWDPMLAATGNGQFPFTPATNLVVGLRTALDMMAAEGGLPAVFARHRRLADAVRCAVAAWGLEFVCTDVAARSNSITAVLLPDGVPDTAIRAGLLERFALTVGGGLGRLGDRCIRIGHLGDVDELMIVGALAGLEMGLPTWLPVRPGGVQAAMDSLGGAGGA